MAGKKVVWALAQAYDLRAKARTTLNAMDNKVLNRLLLLFLVLSNTPLPGGEQALFNIKNYRAIGDGVAKET